MAVVAPLFVVLSLAGCSGSGGGGEEPEQNVPIEDPAGIDEPVDAEETVSTEQPTGTGELVSPEIEPSTLTQLREDDSLISPVPEVVHTQTQADTGLQISYVSDSLIAAAPATYIEEQWIFMLGCIEQPTSPPVILVREGPVVPFTVDDDVVRNESFDGLDISSTPVASATRLYGSVLQISDTDFDGSIGTRGFNLRSIMGRHMWLSAGLPERDYPFSCAQQQP